MEDQIEDRVTLILPKNKSFLEDRYAEVLAEIVAEMLPPQELQYLITELEKKELLQDIG